MANQPSTRKRVFAIRRGPDGSSFQKCRNCGLSVAIALADMHECESIKDVKRFRGISSSHFVVKQSLTDQPRSAFCFFMEEFRKTCKSINAIDVDRDAFEAWKKMCKEERGLFVTRASKVNLAYEKALLKEVNGMPEVNDEADSAMVGKFDPFLESYEDSEDYEDSGSSDGWHTYVEGSEDHGNCENSGWHTYVEGDEDDVDSENSDGSGWHTYVPNGI